MKYIISTIGKDLVTVTDKELAEKFFEQNKEKYSYLKLSEEITNPYPHNGKYTVRKSVAISYRQKKEEQTSFFFYEPAAHHRRDRFLLYHGSATFVKRKNCIFLIHKKSQN